MERVEHRLGRVETFGTKAFGALAAAAAGFSVVSMVQKSIELGDALDKAATKAGITGRAMSELAYAAKISDVDLGTLSNSIKKMQVNLSEAATGGKSQIATLRALGLEFKDLRGLAPDKQFEILAQRISQLKDPADRTRAAVELFGKAGADLLPMFEQGAKGIRALREEAQRMGQSFSDDQLKKLAAADDSIKRLKASWESFSTVLVAKVAPALSAVMDLLSGVNERDDPKELQKLLKGLDPNPNNSAAAAERAKIMARIEAAQAAERSAMVRRRTGRMERNPEQMAQQTPGFEAADAAAEAEEAARKADEKRLARQKAMENDLTEVSTTNVQIREDAWAAYYDSLNDMTMTAGEREEQQFSRLEAALISLRDAGIITAETFNTRMSAALDSMLDSLPEVDKVYEHLEERAQTLSAAQEQIYQGTIDFIADGIRGAFDGSFDEALKGFADMLLEMAIRAQAAQIGQWIFGATGLGGEGGGFLGGLLGGAGKMLQGAFGGGRAAGGPVEPGKAYQVNEHTPKSEWFVPTTGGTIVPHDRMGGSAMSVTNHFSFPGFQGTISRQTEQQIAAAAARGLAGAARRNNA